MVTSDLSAAGGDDFPEGTITLLRGKQLERRITDTKHAVKDLPLKSGQRELLLDGLTRGEFQSAACPACSRS